MSFPYFPRSVTSTVNESIIGQQEGIMSREGICNSAGVRDWELESNGKYEYKAIIRFQ